MPFHKIFCHNTGILHGAKIGGRGRKKGSNLPPGAGVLASLARPFDTARTRMNRKVGIPIIVAALASGLGAYYGGWATVTVENLPDQLVAGTPYNLTFSIRQHGDNLLTDLTPYVQLKSGDSELTAR